MSARQRRERVLALEADYATIGGAVARAFDELLPRVEGRTVLLKPNMLLAWPADWGATTNPALVRACVEEVSRRGGRPLVGDTPSSGYLARAGAVASRTGILEAAGKAWIRIDQEVVDRTLRSTGETVPFCRTALEVDLVVTLPKMKTHALTLMTGAVKNAYGLVAGGAKSRLHRVAPGPAAFAEAVVDVYQVRPPDLVLADAVVAMQGNGPTTRDLCSPGLVVASRNAVAADSVMAAMMGLEPVEVPTLAVAEERGLGPASLEGVELEGRAEPIAGFRLPITYRLGGLAAMGSTVASSTFFASMSRPRLELRADRCVGCKACALGCPAGAIAMVRAPVSGRARPRAAGPLWLPRLDRDRCIGCFCCMEQCPEEAWAFAAVTRAVGELGRLAQLEIGATGDRLLGALRALGRRGPRR